MSTTPTPQQRLALQAAKINLLEASGPSESAIKKAGDVITIHGNALKFDKVSNRNAVGALPSLLMKGSIDETLWLDHDVPLTINHDPKKVVASTGAGTLRLFIAAGYLNWIADLPNCANSRMLSADIKAKRLSGSSLKFKGKGRTVNRAGKTISECAVVTELTDISIVSHPCDTLCTTSVMPTEAEQLQNCLRTWERYRDDAEFKAHCDKQNSWEPLSDREWQQQYDGTKALLAKA